MTQALLDSSRCNRPQPRQRCHHAAENNAYPHMWPRLELSRSARTGPPRRSYRPGQDGLHIEYIYIRRCDSRMDIPKYSTVRVHGNCTWFHCTCVLCRRVHSPVLRGPYSSAPGIFVRISVLQLPVRPRSEQALLAQVLGRPVDLLL